MEIVHRDKRFAQLVKLSLELLHFATRPHEAQCGQPQNRVSRGLVDRRRDSCLLLWILSLRVSHLVGVEQLRGGHDGQFDGNVLVFRWRRYFTLPLAAPLAVRGAWRRRGLVWTP
jgi:hypothetical protein